MNNIQITSDIVTIDGIQYKRVIAEQKSEYPKILSFKLVKSHVPIWLGSTWTLNGDGLYSEFNAQNEPGYTLEDMIHKGNCVDSEHMIIHSVAKSETEVFTVGDETNQGKITGFLLGEDGPGIYVSIEGYEIIKWNVMDLLKTPERKPLFTTEDGKEIFEGDEYFFVFKDNLELNWTTGKNYGLNQNSVRFSTREAAEKYIWDNKPEFSRKQIKEAIEKAGENFRNVCHKETIKNILGL